MTAPNHIADVLAGPHIKRLLHDGAIAFVEVEPLRVARTFALPEIDEPLPRAAILSPSSAGASGRVSPPVPAGGNFSARSA